MSKGHQERPGSDGADRTLQRASQPTPTIMARK
jgi:hypothetical protein